MATLQNIGSMRSSSATQRPDQPTGEVTNRSGSMSAAQLVNSFQQKPAKVQESSSGTPQDFLLNLLKMPNKSTGNTAPPLQAPQPQAPGTTGQQLAQDLTKASLETDKLGEQPRTSRESTPVRIFGATESREHTPFEAPSSAKKNGIFTYVNPFEQLSASSPRPLTPKQDQRATTPKVDASKSHAKSHQTEHAESSAPTKKAKRTESPAPRAASTATSTESAATGSNVKSQSVSEVLNGVGQKVDKQVEKALAQADAAQAASTDTLELRDIKKEDGGQEEEVADSWESAEMDESSPKDTQGVVEVYNFPMRPFVSIEITKSKDPAPLTAELLEIAKLKKDFDQIDRTLVTATASHIAYAMSKNGGFRVIRQDSGRDKQVFKSSQERIFNVQISSNPVRDADYVLATGINGSVYWTTISTSSDDALEEANLEAQGFVLPPVPLQDDNTSGSPVKTRAKLSSRHPEFFGVSRGKSIHIISTSSALSASYTDKKNRIVDVDRFLPDRDLKIATGKAGKDFCFSEDDSLIVSLDKAGRIKFWDIRELSDAARDSASGKRPSIEQKNPLMTLTTTMPSEKVSPTSIMFADKERPCIKGIALRYLIVGLKQNHVLQLWDLGLGKPVQELHFPHDKDSDAICSIAYHAKTGIITLGHPTRNSIYFIHLSAPRYHIPSLDQARYITMVASQDPSLPKPESTAIMSGIRELSFASKGQLRSVDMLKTPTASSSASVDGETLFELYAMHSKGVTCLNIKKKDLGWGPDNKVLAPIDAEKAGVISISAIKTPVDASSEGDASSKPSTSAVAGSAIKEEEKPPVTPHKDKKAEVSATNGTTKAENKKEMPVLPAADKSVNPPIITPESYSVATRSINTSAPEPTQLPVRAREPSPARPAPAVAPAPKSILSNGDSQNDVQGMASSMSANITNSLLKEFDSLYRKVDDDRRIQDAAASARQDAVLRLVSSTLTDNVEKSLDKIVTTSIQQLVVPAVSDVVNAVVDRKLSESLSHNLSVAVPREIKAALPPAVSRAMQDKEVLRVISEQTATKISTQIEQTIGAVLKNTIMPNFSSLSVAATQKAVADVEQRFSQKLQQAELQRQKDNAEIKQLSNLVLRLSETVHGMAASQSSFQEQILKLQRQVEPSARTGSTRSATSSKSDVVPSVEDEELEQITALMTEGHFEEGTIKVCYMVIFVPCKC